MIGGLFIGQIQIFAIENVCNARISCPKFQMMPRASILWKSENNHWLLSLPRQRSSYESAYLLNSKSSVISKTSCSPKLYGVDITSRDEDKLGSAFFRTWGLPNLENLTHQEMIQKHMSYSITINHVHNVH